MTTTETDEKSAASVASVKPVKTDESEFVKGIIKLYERGETGKLAQLRRAAGDPLGADLKLMWFYDQLAWSAPWVTGKSNEENMYFLVATLLAFDRRALENKTPTPVSNFGHTLRLMKDTQAGSAEAIERRFRILLDAEAHELPFRLRQMVKLVLSRGGIINWGRLLTDLRQWTLPCRKVQKDWARSFYTGDNTAVAPSQADAIIDTTDTNDETTASPAALPERNTL